MNEELWHRWFSQETKKLAGSGTYGRPKRQYLHFDNKISALNEQLTKQMLQPEAVTRHSYYPFLRVDTREKRYRRSKDNKQRREQATKRRPIDFAAHKDSLVFSWYATLLAGPYEARLESRRLCDCVIAYRRVKSVSEKSKNTVDFASEVFTCARSNAPSVILALDISGFFEQIDHGILREKWADVIGTIELPTDHQSVFEAVTSYRFVRRGRLRKQFEEALRQHKPRILSPAEFKQVVIEGNLQERGLIGKGIPQGSPISCVLANMYMIDFDDAVYSKILSLGGMYRRYSDDILIVCPPDAAAEIESFVEHQIVKLELQIKPSKTERRLCIIKDGEAQMVDISTQRPSPFQYLGIETDGKTESIRHGSLARFQRRMNRSVRRAASNTLAVGKKALPKRALHRKYAEAKNNFLAYGVRAAEILKSHRIKKQLSVTRAARKLKKRLKALSERFRKEKN